MHAWGLVLGDIAWLAPFRSTNQSFLRLTEFINSHKRVYRLLESPAAQELQLCFRQLQLEWKSKFWLCKLSLT
jgi:hypothetical protein